MRANLVGSQAPFSAMALLHDSRFAPGLVQQITAFDEQPSLGALAKLKTIIDLRFEAKIANKVRVKACECVVDDKNRGGLCVNEHDAYKTLAAMKEIGLTDRICAKLPPSKCVRSATSRIRRSPSTTRWSKHRTDCVLVSQAMNAS